jgi:hypothetical protein
MAEPERLGNILDRMLKRGSLGMNYEQYFSALKLHKHDPTHAHPDDTERLDCGCPWFECIHCIHDILRIACMQCSDPFKDITN